MSTTYAKASEKLGPIQAATKSISKEVFDAAAKAGHEIWYMWGYDGDASNTEHHSGRALDFMVHNHDAGQWVRNYIWTNRQRLRLQHVIWEQHITSTVTSPGVVRKMNDRGNTTANHMDHVHALFFAGSYQKSSPSSPDPSNPSKKTVDQIAHEIVEKGNWGNGPDRVRKLLAAGYDPKVVQARVEELLTPSKGKKTPRQVADEIVRGVGGWGNDPQRSKKLKAAGYNPTDVQREINKLMRR
jgi:hypothetical protein